MAHLNNVTLTVCDVMGWQAEDVYALNIWLEAYANLLGRDQEEKAVNCIRNALAVASEFPVTDINQWFHTAISIIFYELALILKQDEAYSGHATLHGKLRQLEQAFAPSINCAASSFNNCFDQIDFEQDRESIVRQAITLLTR